MDLNKLIEEIFREEEIYKCILSFQKDKENKLLKITVRPILLQGKTLYQVTHHYETKELHQNYETKELHKLLINLIGKTFRQALLQTNLYDYHIYFEKDNQAKIKKKRPTGKSLPLSHNRQKNYILSENEPFPFLIALGIQNQKGGIKNEKRSKFLQINRFLEVVADILSHLDLSKKVKIVDFGCGKAYLTFALYYYLSEIKKLPITITGIDLKEEVILQCQTLANQLGYNNLHFSIGNITDFDVEEKVSMVVALHACNTATDIALSKAVKSGADIILAAPCCQHELFSQVSSDDLHPLLEHGLLKERFAALVTDAARGKLLETVGYQVQMIEFIDAEHTPKNLLIRAVRKGKSSSKAKNEYERFKRALGIKPFFETLLTSN